MKKTLVFICLFFVTVTVGLTIFLKFPPWQIGNAIQIATGLGAKLACSNHFIAKLPHNKIIDDLASYSPVTRLLEYNIDENSKSVTATLWSLNSTVAEYREGLGCTIAIGNTAALDEINLPEIPKLNIAAPWPVGDNVQSINPRIQERVSQQLLQDNSDNKDTRALVVVHNGNIIAESYSSGIDKDSPLLGWSMAKTVTAILIGNLIYENQLSLEQNDLFEKWKQDERSKIKLEHLLSMTSGLYFDETYQPGTDSTKMLFSSHSASSVAIESPAKHAPGEHFSYSSGTTNLLSRILFDTTGGLPQSHYEHLYKALVIPLNLDSLVFEPDASGVMIGSSYVYATARDWAKLGLLIANGGELNGHRVMSESYTQALLQPNNSKNEPKYGFQTWINQGEESMRWEDLPKDAIAMRGNRSQMVLIVPSKNIVIVRLGWTSGHYGLNERLSPLFKYVVDEAR